MNTGAVLSGKKRRRLLQSRRPSVPERAPSKATLPFRKLSHPGSLPSRWTWARGGITSPRWRVVKATTTTPTPVLFSLYVDDMPSPSHHVELALFADDTAIIATSRKPKLLVSYLESYLKELQRRLTEWRMAINFSKSTAIIFARAGRRFMQPRPVTLFGEPFQWVDTTLYLGVTLDTRLKWSPHFDQFRKENCSKFGYVGAPPE